MKEELITFETAKLAKEKGFDERVWGAYYKGNRSGASYDDGPIKWNSDSDFGGEDTQAAPTQSLLRRWLRERHMIDIWMSPCGEDGELYHAEDIVQEGGFSHCDKTKSHGTYELALEEGLQEALKLIK